MLCGVCLSESLMSCVKNVLVVGFPPLDSSFLNLCAGLQDVLPGTIPGICAALTHRLHPRAAQSAHTRVCIIAPFQTLYRAAFLILAGFLGVSLEYLFINSLGFQEHMREAVAWCVQLLGTRALTRPMQVKGFLILRP